MPKLCLLQSHAQTARLRITHTGRLMHIFAHKNGKHCLDMATCLAGIVKLLEARENCYFFLLVCWETKSS